MHCVLQSWPAACGWAAVAAVKTPSPAVAEIADRT